MPPSEEGSGVLVYGGSLQVPFQPDEMAYSPRTGRLYHPWGRRGYGLIRSQIAVELCEHMSGLSAGEGQEEEGSPTLVWGGRVP